MSNGLVHIYTGDGKGKTSAATGLAVRCAGRGKSVVFYQFLKATESAEVDVMKKAGVKVKRVSSSDKFYPCMSDGEKLVAKREILDALSKIYDEECDLLVLDEALCVLDLGIADFGYMTEIIEKKPEETELVLTGRNAPEALYGYADYVSEIKCIKHPFDKGVKAREGIEY